MPVLPLIMTEQGLQPAAPADLRARLISLVAASNPDYTANLPGSLIEDISSTDTYACVESDSFLVDLVNSITPYGANAYLLNQLGVLYGIDQQPVTNTSVFVIFTGPPGYVVAQGFVVGDGTYQYVCQEGSICGTNGSTLPVYAIATQSGAWPVVVNTVTTLVTSVPANISLSVINQVDGFPSTSGEPISVWRERCFTAGLAASTGMGRYLKTLLANVAGVQSRLISVRQDGSNFIVICGGGDPYHVAHAIWEADFYTAGLSGATIRITNITRGNPTTIYTADNHNLATGDIERFDGIVGFPFLNGLSFPVTVTVSGDIGYNPKKFTIPIDSTQWGAYQYGGIVTPNPINNIVTITDFPDEYSIPYVIPPQETVSMVVTWETNSVNFVSVAAIAQASIPALVDYINSLPAGTTPINLNVLNSVFLDAVSQILPSELIIALQFQIAIDGVGVFTQPGTQCIFGDPNSYFYTENGMIAVIESIGE